ncbi:MAG: hypothetical protein AAB317_04445 [Nitrospirota bacterium]
MHYLEQRFPALAGTEYRITSPALPDYNCIAWAAGNASHWWEPDDFGFYYWPDNVPRDYTLDAYTKAFNQLGFELCENLDCERDWEKVVLYAKEDGFPTHAARQLPDGAWTSKLGKGEDISHGNLDGLCGDAYGKPAVIMRRDRKPKSNP